MENAQQEQSRAEYYERQYNNRLSIPDAAAYNARAVALAKVARRDVRCSLDVPYGRSDRERFDIFYGLGGAPRPVLVFIHGGYWRSRDKSEFSFVAPAFCAAGVTVALPTYDLAPAVTVEQIVEQMRAAHAWLYRTADDFNIDRRHIFVAGHSAGAHLAALMLSTPWSELASDLPSKLVKGACCVSGVYDLEPMLHFSFNKEIKLDAESASRLSPLGQRPHIRLPLYTAVGSLESEEFKRQAREIRQAWPHCHAGHIEVAGCHHLSIVEAFASPATELFQRTLGMVAAPNEQASF